MARYRGRFEEAWLGVMGLLVVGALVSLVVALAVLAWRAVLS